MIELVVNGIPYTDFTSVIVTLSMESVANDFEFTASAVDAFPPFKYGDQVVVSVDGEKKLTGYIDEISGVDQNGSHTVSYAGRDRTSDLIDSTLDTLSDIRANDTLTLKRLIEIVIAHLGSNLTVIDTVRPAAFNVAEDRVIPQVGQGALEFILAFARKRQCLLSSNGDGDIVIVRSSPTDSGAIVQRLTGANDNNILSQGWNMTGSKLFNSFAHRGQLDPLALNFAGSSDIATSVDQSGRVTNSAIRRGRQMVVVESESYSDEQLKDRAKWASQLAKARATRFNCVVKGHRSTAGELWEENTLVQVLSDVADISRQMLVNTVSFSQAEKQPTTTALEFVEKNVYTIDEKLLAQRPAGGLNDVFGNLG